MSEENKVIKERLGEPGKDDHYGDTTFVCNAIDYTHDAIIEASAGTGKTTVMIERLYQMITNDDVDLSQVIVVTFTKLAANQMKEKLTSKLMGDKGNPKVLQQLEKIRQEHSGNA